MSKSADAEQIRTEELAAAIREVQARVRSRHPGGTFGDTNVVVPDLMRLIHARDAGDAKVAAIGTVNPRPVGLLNGLVQSAKKLVARALDWHVREQVEFNRAVMGCVQAILEISEENNRALSQMVAYIQTEASKVRAEMLDLRSEMAVEAGRLRAQTSELSDVRAHWVQWRESWEEKLNRSEIYLLRSLSELNAGFQHRATVQEQAYKEVVRTQHSEFSNALSKAALEVQQRMWSDFQSIRAEFERMIHYELRVMRQRHPTPAAPDSPAPAIADDSTPHLDWLRFADRFRGAEDSIRAAQQLYVDRFGGAVNVLDIGCGRGEFLQAAKLAGIEARGIDLNPENVALCRARGLEAEVADIFEYLPKLQDNSLGGLYCSQVIEHLPPGAVPELVRIASAKLNPGALMAVETPNPECLAIFASHFYLDPTHTRPVPSALMAFYLEEAGFGQIEIKKLAPAVDTMRSLADLPESFREAFFGGLDYAIFARKL